jgi:DNA-binding transcriptional ArsR family regulator
MYVVRPESENTPDIWQALSDPTRRHLIDVLSHGPKTTSALCEGLAMTRFGVMKHIGVLERAGLITARRHGKFRLNHLNRAPLAMLYEKWMSPRARQLANAVSNIQQISEGTKMSTNDQPTAQIVEVAMDWTISASPQAVWDTLTTQVGSWWPVEHRAGPPGAEMSLNPVPGGTLAELASNGAGIEWYRVIAVDPRKSIDLAGQLASRYGGSATSLLHISIEPGIEENRVVMRLTDSVFGRVGPNLHASLTSGWEAIIGQGLVANLQTPK